MSLRRRNATSKNVLFSALAVIIVAAGTGAAAYVSQLNTPTSATSATSTSQSHTATSTTADTASPLGLQLMLNVQTITNPNVSGRWLNVSLSNTLSMQLVLAPGAVGLGLSLGPCNQLPIGVGIFSGNYNLANLSKAAPLDLYQPGTYNCPALFSVADWSFAPGSDNVTLVSQQPSGSGNATTTENMWTQPAAASIQLSGYWTGGNESAVFHQFSPGVYTAVAADEWGDTQIITFNIPSLASTGSNSSSDA